MHNRRPPGRRGGIDQFHVTHAGQLHQGRGIAGRDCPLDIVATDDERNRSVHIAVHQYLGNTKGQ